MTADLDRRSTPASLAGPPPRCEGGRAPRLSSVQTSERRLIKSFVRSLNRRSPFWGTDDREDVEPAPEPGAIVKFTWLGFCRRGRANGEGWSFGMEREAAQRRTISAPACRTHPDAIPTEPVSFLSDSCRLLQEGDRICASLLLQSLHCGSRFVGCGSWVREINGWWRGNWSRTAAKASVQGCGPVPRPPEGSAG